MDVLEVKIFTAPRDRDRLTEVLDIPQNSLVFLNCRGIDPDINVSEIENAIIGVLREFGCLYALKSGHRTFSWGLSGSSGDIVAHVAEFAASASSFAVGALTQAIVQRVLDRLFGSVSSRQVDRESATSMKAVEAEARDFLRSQFGQEATISLLCAKEIGEERYAFQYECGELRVEAIAGRDGTILGYRRF